MRKTLVLGLAFFLLGTVQAQTTASRVIEVSAATRSPQALSSSLFASEDGWSIAMKLGPGPLPLESTLLVLAGKDGKDWLKGAVTGDKEHPLLSFALHTDFNPDPLTIGIPVAMLPRQGGDLLLRYRGYGFELYLNGVLIDEEWPIGKILAGAAPTLTALSPLRSISVWDHPLSDQAMVARSGGAGNVAAAQQKLLGPEPQYIQYSRPRGYNTNAGDAMPFSHNGEFSLYYLFDRRHHRSKWGLGAHQWAHVSSTDLVHWTESPKALRVDHEWEGSICTGSVFFHNGKYYAFYATRMPDRNQRLAMAESADGIHFQKVLPTPFAEPQAPFVRGPNRDPFVFEANGQFHMIVTAAIATDGGKGKEGALEHLVSPDLKTWKVEKEPFLTSGSDLEPECSDLFQWGDWYYLFFSLGGTTHYRMARNPLGPWIKPEVDILDGPEAKVMKAASFQGNRMLLVGFVQFDKRYGGDLLFRELVRQQGGTLGTTTPREVQLPEAGRHSLPPFDPSGGHKQNTAIDLGGPSHLRATLSLAGRGKVTLHLKGGSQSGVSPDLVFDPASGTVSWTDHFGSEPTVLQQVDMRAALHIDLILDGSLADLEIDGQRSMIHRLAIPRTERLSFSTEGEGTSVSGLQLSSVTTRLQAGTENW
jgi:hypothetical protein